MTQMSIIDDKLLASLFRPEPIQVALEGVASAGRTYELTGIWSDGHPFHEKISASSTQDAVNKAFERFDPLVCSLTITEVT